MLANSRQTSLVALAMDATKVQGWPPPEGEEERSQLQSCRWPRRLRRLKHISKFLQVAGLVAVLVSWLGLWVLMVGEA